MRLMSLKERVVIQSRAHISDQLGGYQISWADQGEIWAEIKPLNSQKYERDAAPQMYKVRWRWGTQISHLSRLKWGSSYMRFMTRPQSDVDRKWYSAIVKAEGGGTNE